MHVRWVLIAAFLAVSGCATTDNPGDTHETWSPEQTEIYMARLAALSPGALVNELATVRNGRVSSIAPDAYIFYAWALEFLQSDDPEIRGSAETALLLAATTPVTATETQARSGPGSSRYYHTVPRTLRGLPEAQYHLAEFYQMQGEGAHADRSIALLERAASAGYRPATEALNRERRAARQSAAGNP